MYLCMDNMKAIRSLIDTLRIRSLDTRVCRLNDRAPYCPLTFDIGIDQEVILDTFFEVLMIETPAWYNTFLEGRRLTS